MSLKELDGGLVALMEIHCREYRSEYGHLRVDGRGPMDPIPFPNRQMPTFFVLRALTDKGLKLWMQIERTLYDHYETPVDLGRHPLEELRPRQTGKATRANFLAALLDLPAPILTNPKRYDTPIRSDVKVDWDAVLYGGRGGRATRSMGHGVHGDKEDITIIGADPGAGLFSRMRQLHNTRHFDIWPMRVEDEDPPEREHSTDYQRRKGWKRIPLQFPNPAKPSPVLLALLKRSA